MVNDGSSWLPTGRNKIGLSFVGALVQITINDTGIHAGLKGVDQSFYSYDYPTSYDASNWTIEMQSYNNESQWLFYEPCIPL